MMKKVIALLTVCFMLVSVSSPAIAADELHAQPLNEENTNAYSDTLSVDEIANASTDSQLTSLEAISSSGIIGSIPADSDLVIVHDQETNNRIDALFAQRCKLAIDFASNQEEIDKIDCELAQLGVETISYAEVQSKAGGNLLPNVEFYSNDSNSQWTSRRTVVTYNGQQYELQIIEGIPLNKNSWLRQDDVEIEYEASGIVAGITEVIEIVSVTAMGFVPVLSGLSNGFTVLSMIADGYEAIHNSLQTTTVIENISGTAYLALSSHVKFIYVKGYGSSDSYQVLGYLGNYLYFAVATVSTLDGAVGEHGSLPVISVDLSNSGEVYSAYFNDYTKSVQNYTYYRNNNLSGYVPECLMQYLTLDLFNTVDAYAIPLSSPHITLPTA